MSSVVPSITNNPRHSQTAAGFAVSHAAPRHVTVAAAAFAVLSIDGRVLYTNPAADILFRLQDGFAIQDDRLELPHHTGQLRQALTWASGLGCIAKGSEIVVNRTGYQWRLICLPLPPAWLDRALCSPGASLVMVLSGEAPEPSALWQSIYGLSVEEVFWATRLMFAPIDDLSRAPKQTMEHAALQAKTGANDLASLRHLLMLSAGLIVHHSN